MKVKVSQKQTLSNCGGDYVQAQNMSDVIESYLKSILEEQRQIEIRRAEIADRFNCVPSQINYVIKTRFTPQRGYVVESKRGGGGYIRIVKANLRPDPESVAALRANIPSHLAERDARIMTQQLFDAGIIQRETGNAMLSAMSHNELALEDNRLEEMIRARLFKAFLDSLRFAN
ncbi:transcriptional repressor [Lacticaseibacillus sharpeae JCM 1186 = DSM 20505]|uniref:Transcriptional regulator CtsR n=1 Tax=Lacticaseibacillus sharpeae JCM 1186 = DSM 20505 TaxID=1291052 RepID=A0A0R1ZM74_9LACO|nr:transcriptional repressor [Lacticaseibacillus sharpeae JCM 1186 = DSM 20505]